VLLEVGCSFYVLNIYLYYLVTLRSNSEEQPVPSDEVKESQPSSPMTDIDSQSDAKDGKAMDTEDKALSEAAKADREGNCYW
jgi:hypothetical protein